jgi:hypothetical protein
MTARGLSVRRPAKGIDFIGVIGTLLLSQVTQDSMLVEFSNQPSPKIRKNKPKEMIDATHDNRLRCSCCRRSCARSFGRQDRAPEHTHETCPFRARRHDAGFK